MAKWKCEICGQEFDNYYAQGFNNKIYCPLCYFKQENIELKEELKKNKEDLREANKKILEYIDLLNTILDFDFFESQCPLNFGYVKNSNEDKAQDIFYNDNGAWCEKYCNDNYNKCWLKYFMELQRLNDEKEMK